MCGITGLIHLDNEPVSPAVLQRMTDAIVHRGPDGEGHWIEGNVGIGHRRLAIIDPTPAGHQPMLSPDGRFVLTYNGEIYNFRELQAELEAKGYWFRSRCDSEVVLHALCAWGSEALKRFNGMFALALWDRKEKVLLLARDRYGIKPLYIGRQGKLFAFGSEQKAPRRRRWSARNIGISTFANPSIRRWTRSIARSSAGCSARPSTAS
jgi:asparagine synthase (glutamine-hydrolysing)